MATVKSKKKKPYGHEAYMRRSKSGKVSFIRKKGQKPQKIKITGDNPWDKDDPDASYDYHLFEAIKGARNTTEFMDAVKGALVDRLLEHGEDMGHIENEEDFARLALELWNAYSEHADNGYFEMDELGEDHDLFLDWNDNPYDPDSVEDEEEHATEQLMFDMYEATRGATDFDEFESKLEDYFAEIYGESMDGYPGFANQMFAAFRSMGGVSEVEQPPEPQKSPVEFDDWEDAEEGAAEAASYVVDPVIDNARGPQFQAYAPPNVKSNALASVEPDEKLKQVFGSKKQRQALQVIAKTTKPEGADFLPLMREYAAKAATSFAYNDGLHGLLAKLANDIGVDPHCCGLPDVDAFLSHIESQTRKSKKREAWDQVLHGMALIHAKWRDKAMPTSGESLFAEAYPKEGEQRPPSVQLQPHPSIPGAIQATVHRFPSSGGYKLEDTVVFEGVLKPEEAHTFLSLQQNDVVSPYKQHQLVMQGEYRSGLARVHVTSDAAHLLDPDLPSDLASARYALAGMKVGRIGTPSSTQDLHSEYALQAPRTLLSGRTVRTGPNKDLTYVLTGRSMRQDENKGYHPANILVQAEGNNGGAMWIPLSEVHDVIKSFIFS